MKKYKSVLSLLLVLVMLCSLAGSAVFAEGEGDNDPPADPPAEGETEPSEEAAPAGETPAEETPAAPAPVLAAAPMLGASSGQNPANQTTNPEAITEHVQIESSVNGVSGGTGLELDPQSDSRIIVDNTASPPSVEVTADVYIPSDNNILTAVTVIDRTNDSKSFEATLDGNISIAQKNNSTQALVIWNMNDNIDITAKGDITAKESNQTAVKVGYIGNYQGEAETTFQAGSKEDPKKITGGKYGIDAQAPYAQDSIEITVYGDVESTGSTDSAGVRINETKGTVTVNVRKDASGKGGNVTGNDAGVYIDNGTVNVEGTVTSKENIGVIAWDGSAVNVGDSVTSEKIGVQTNGSTVTVGEDVTGGSTGIEAGNGSTVEVGEDVTGGSVGIQVKISSDTDKQSTIVVEGTLKETGTDGHVIELNVPDRSTLETIENALPEIIVNSIDTDADYVICSGVTNEKDKKAIEQKVMENIEYIIKTEVKNENNSDSSVTIDLVNYNVAEGGVLKEHTKTDGSTLTVATSKTQLKVGLDRKSGTIVGLVVKDADGKDYQDVVKQDDGTWLITVGTSGLKITATVKDPEPEPEKKPEKKEESKKEEKAETRTLSADTGAAAFTFDYQNHTLSIDMTRLKAQTLLRDTLQRFQRRGIETLVVKVAGGSFTVSMTDLLDMIGSAPSVTLKLNGDTMEIIVNGQNVTTLVMTAA